MSKTELKEVIGIIIFAVINTCIAFAITNFLGIANTIIYQSFSTMSGSITWEVVIFMVLSLIEALIYENGSLKFITDKIFE